jgi:hypothetical protein
LKQKLFLLLVGTVLSAMVLGACNRDVNNNDQIAPQRINNPVDKPNDRNIDNNLNRNNLDRNNINEDVNNRNNLDRNNMNEDVNNRNNLDRNNMNDHLNNPNNNYYNPSEDINTDNDKDMIKDNNTKKEDIIEDDIDTKDRDQKDE